MLDLDWRGLCGAYRRSLRVAWSQGSWLVRGQLLPTFPRGLGIVRSTSRASSHLFAYPFAQIAHTTLVTQRGRLPQIRRTSCDTPPDIPLVRFCTVSSLLFSAPYIVFSHICSRVAGKRGGPWPSKSLI